MPLCVRTLVRGIIPVGIAAAALALAAAAQGPDVPVVGTMPEDYLPGLKPLLDTALKQSPRMIASELQIAAADGQRLTNGLSPLLPQVGGQVQYGTQSTSFSANAGASTKTTGFVYQGSVSQNLFQWGYLKSQLEVWTIARTINEKNYAEGFRVFAGLIRRQYLSLVANRMALRNSRFELNLSQKLLAAAQANYKNGTIAAGDLVGPTLEVEERQLGVDRAAQAYDFARRTLAHEVGLTDLADDSIPAEIPLPKYEPETASMLLATLLRDGARDTFQTEVQELNVKQQKEYYNMAKVRLLPRFSANVGFNEYFQNNVVGGQVTQTALLNEFYWMQAQWTIFDGLATRGAKLSALNARRSYERQLQMTAEDIMDQAQNSRRTLDFAYRAMDLAERRRALAADGLRRTRDEFKLGNQSQDSLNGSIDIMNVNEYGAIAARADFLSSWSDFVSLVGMDPAMNNLPARYVRPVR